MIMYQLFKLEEMKLKMNLYCVSVGSRNAVNLQSPVRQKDFAIRCLHCAYLTSERCLIYRYVT